MKTTLATRVVKKYSVVTAALLHGYRATVKILPSKIEHRYDGGGIFGKGTYFGLTLDIAAQYAHSDTFSFIYKYTISPQKLLTLASDDDWNIGYAELFFTAQGKQKIHEDKIFQKDLSSVASALGYDCIYLIGGSRIGGDQILIPISSSLQPKPISFSLLYNEAVIDDLIEDGISGHKEQLKTGLGNSLPTFGLIDIPLTQEEECEKILKKTFKMSMYQYLDPDMRKLTRNEE